MNTPDDRLKELVEAHPDPNPPYDHPDDKLHLIDIPSSFSHSARFRLFRASVAGYVRDEPDDAYWPFLLDAIDRVLAWRETIPPHERFWFPDPPEPWPPRPGNTVP